MRLDTHRLDDVIAYARHTWGITPTRNRRDHAGSDRYELCPVCGTPASEFTPADARAYVVILEPGDRVLATRQWGRINGDQVVSVNPLHRGCTHTIPKEYRGLREDARVVRRRIRNDQTEDASPILRALDNAQQEHEQEQEQEPSVPISHSVHSDARNSLYDDDCLAFRMAMRAAAPGSPA